MPYAEASRFLTEFDPQIQQRVGVLTAANDRVRGLESDLQRQLAEGRHTAAGVSAEDYATQFRRVHAEPYRQADQAATDLSQFLAAQMPTLNAALSNPTIAGSPAEGGVALGSLDQATHALEAYHAQTPGDHSSLATILKTAAGGAGFAAGRASAHVGEALGGPLARVGGALGALGSAISLGQQLDTFRRGQDNAGTWMQAGAAGAGMTAGALRVAGMAVPGLGQVSMAATVVGVAGGMYSTVADRSRNAEEAAATLRAAGVPDAAADAISRARPETLRAYEAAGLTPQQIQELATAAPGALQMLPDTVQPFLRTIGVRGDQLLGVLKAAGAGAPALITYVADQDSSYARPGNRAELLRSFDRPLNPLSPTARGAVDYLRSLP